MKQMFSKDVPFTMKINGSVDGKQNFYIEGEGTGNAKTGYQSGRWVCKTGEVPVAWEALSATLGYGYKCFIKLPAGVKSFFIDSFPEGYTQEKTLDFENDGTLQVMHMIYVKEGVVMNDVILNAIGFKPDSPILNNGIEVNLPSVETYYDIDGGVKSSSTHLYPLKKPIDGNKYAICKVTHVHKPLNKMKQISYPGHHYVQNHAAVSKDSEQCFHYEGCVGFIGGLLGQNNEMKV